MTIRGDRASTPTTESGVLLGIDLGTSGVKAVLVSVASGGVVAEGYSRYPSATGSDGRHEQNPDNWWRACAVAVRQALGGASSARVLAVGLSGHTHGVVLVDKYDRYVRPALTWADRRSHRQVQQLRRHESLFAERCANPVVEAFSAPKVAWLVEQEPESLHAAARMVSPKDSLRHRFTGTWGTDLSDARGSLLFDVHTDKWDADLWRLCGADSALGPQVSPSTAIVGHVLPDAEADTGIPTGTPVVAGATDVACAALGAGLVHEGPVYVNAGTAVQVLLAMPSVQAGDWFVFGRADSPGYLSMTSVYAAGLSADWAARTLLGGSEAGYTDGSALDEVASREQPGAGGLVFVPHLLGSSAPTHDSGLRGALVGLGVDQHPGTVARAVLEGIAYASASAVQHLRKSASKGTDVRVGGGLARSRVWSQALAAVLDVPVHHLRTEASPLGAAVLAGIGVGIWANADVAANSCVFWDEVPTPSSAERGKYRNARDRYDVTAEMVADLSRRLRERELTEVGTLPESSDGLGVTR